MVPLLRPEAPAPDAELAVFRQGLSRGPMERRLGHPELLLGRDRIARRPGCRAAAAAGTLADGYAGFNLAFDLLALGAGPGSHAGYHGYRRVNGHGRPLKRGPRPAGDGRPGAGRANTWRMAPLMETGGMGATTGGAAKVVAPVGVACPRHRAATAVGSFRHCDVVGPGGGSARGAAWSRRPGTRTLHGFRPWESGAGGA
ncbi:MAG: hypothetical protein WKG07_23930 [Hymenobacter sp.]